MKKMFVFLLAVIGMIPAGAEDVNGASLKLDLGEFRGAEVRINGNVYRQSSNSLWLKDLRPGHNRIVIRRHRPGNGRGHAHGHGHGRQFTASLYLEAGATTFAVIGRNRNIRIERVEYYGGYRDVNHHACMDYHAFNLLMDRMQRAHFDEDRLAIAMDAVRIYGTNTAMLRDMMQLLYFEGNRLELAKYAYPYTIDKRNYHQLYNAFHFSSSIRELENYIRRHCH